MSRKRHSVAKFSVAAVLAAGLTTLVQGHEDLERKIAAVSRQLLETPDDPTLYLRRGEYHRLHRDWGQALLDYQQSETLDPQQPALNLVRGQLYVDQREGDKALLWAKKAIQADPENPRSWLLQSEALALCGQYLEAAQSAEEAVQRLKEPRPEIFLAAAGWLEAAGPSRRPAALEVLLDGLARLPGCITLELAALDLETALERFGAALARIARLHGQSPRDATWLARQSEVLVFAGRWREALAVCDDALSRIQAYPDQVKRRPLTQSWVSRIQKTRERIVRKLEERRS